jgi:hypothetical protein
LFYSYSRTIKSAFWLIIVCTCRHTQIHTESSEIFQAMILSVQHYPFIQKYSLIQKVLHIFINVWKKFYSIVQFPKTLLVHVALPLPQVCSFDMVTAWLSLPGSLLYTEPSCGFI